MSFTTINLHDVARIVIEARVLPSNTTERWPHFFTEIVVTDTQGNRIQVTAFSATASAIPIEGATLTNEVPA